MDGQEKLLDYETIKAAVAAAITCTPPKQIHPLRVCTCFGG